MRLSRCLLGVILVVHGLAVAQTPVEEEQQSEPPQLQRSVVQAGAELTDTQREGIKAYVDYWVGQLETSPDNVPMSRTQIDSPFKEPGATNIFISVYSRAVSRRLIDAIDAERHPVATRVHAMLSARQVAGGGVEHLVRAGLADPNPAVRYLAAKVVAAAGSRPEVDIQQKATILNLAVVSVGGEDSQLVAGQLLLGMLGLARFPDAGDAREALLQALDQRVEGHAEKPNSLIDSDRKALRELFRYYVRDIKGKPPTNEAVLLARVAYRLYYLSATVLDEQLADEGMDKQYGALIKDCDTILRWQLTDPKVTEPLPDEEKVKVALMNKHYQELVEYAGHWRQLLAGPPLNINVRRLEVSFP